MLKREIGVILWFKVVRMMIVGGLDCLGLLRYSN